MDFAIKSIPVWASERMIAKAMEIPWSFKEDAELVYCKSGWIRVIAPDGFQAFVLQEGQGVFISPRTMNRIVSGDDESVIRSIVFSPEILWLDTTSRIYSEEIIPIMTSQEGLISLSEVSAANISRVFDVIAQKEFAYEIESRDILSAIMLFLIREKGKTNIEVPKLRNERLLKMVEYIKEHYKEEISLSDIAKAGLISEREALRIFSKSLGESPIHFLIGYRLSMGAKLLESSDLNIDQISEKVGFESSSHFAKLFKRSYSLTPTQYRRWFLNS